MADTTFITGTTITSDWLNEVNDHVHHDTPVVGTTVHNSDVIGFTQSGTGAVARTAQAKMLDVVSVFDFMTAAQIADVRAGTKLLDLTSAIQAAIDGLGIGGTLHFPAGSYYIAGALSITTRVNLVGDGRASELSFTHANSRLNVSGTELAKLESNLFSDLLFVGISTQTVGATPASASVINLNWLKYTKFQNCFFYHTNINTDHMAWWSIDHCEFFDLEFTNNYTQLLGEPNDISAGPKIDNSFMSVCQMTNTDVVDVHITNTHWFNGEWAIKFRKQYWTPTGGTVIGLPFFITNSTFDAIEGHALDVYDGFSVLLSNCWFSAGRGFGVDGVSIYRSNRVSIVNCSFYFCGGTNPSAGITINDCSYVSVIGGTYSNNFTYGIRVVASNNVSIIGGTFSNNPSIFGGGYTQTDGVTDTAGTSTYVTVMGCHFDPTLVSPIYLPSVTNNFLNNSGVNYNVVTGTSLYPAVDMSMTLGTPGIQFLNVYSNAMKSSPVLVGGLPAAATSGSGTKMMVSDANATAFNSIVAGGGANVVPVYSDGTNWRIG